MRSQAHHLGSWSRLPLALAALLFVAGCNGSLHETEERTTGAAVITLALPESMGPLERPAVEFDHARHEQAQKGKCADCHLRKPSGGYSLLFARLEDGADRDAQADHYHDTCIGCHKKTATTGAASGPLTCAECHARRPRATSRRTPIRFDASLHYRHVSATEQKCETCHHVLDKATDKLVYRKGEEATCGYCHGAADRARVPSGRNASHKSCVGCHLARGEAQRKTGPTSCQGCHEKSAQAVMTVVREPARLLTRQKDRMLVRSTGSTTPGVAFDHLAHEKLGLFCTSCHHETMGPCATCHGQGKAAKQGGGVGLDDSHHDRGSRHSCVGCHQKNVDRKECAGCHKQLPPAPATASCAVCHAPPASPTVGGPPPTDAGTDAAAGAPEPSAAPAMPDPWTLPPTGEAFPEEIEIKRLARTYEPSRFPHRKIVKALLRGTQTSTLAKRFHGRSETLCAGCHHHSPKGSRPTACASCHGPDGDATRDQPGLLPAYHRQCLGCHQTMGLPQQGCTDCHKARGTKPKEAVR